jgi:hypothetical protein
MRKLAIVCGLCLLAAGCFQPMRMRDEAAKPGAPAPPVPAKPAQVQPESITESNAQAKVLELKAEIDFELQKK